MGSQARQYDGTGWAFFAYPFLMLLIVIHHTHYQIVLAGGIYNLGYCLITILRAKL